MKKDISAAKITKPSIAGVLPRERLFRIIDDSRQRPIVWLSGPAGSGKTTLVASYLDSRELPCLWYRVDLGDADIATFFYYLGLAANKATPPLKNLPLLTPEYLHGIPVFTRRYFEHLCNGLASPFILVFDNYQDVSDASGFHDMIVQGLDAVPDGITVIIISRKAPPTQLARLRAERKIAYVGWDDIRFTFDESRDAVRLHGNRSIADETLVELYGKTQGWIAGVVLIRESSRREPIDTSILGQLLPEAIFDYFAGEIFQKSDSMTREFLLKTSVLDEMTPRMADNLTGIQTSEAILSLLNRNHYFIEMRVSEESVYQYHPMFRQFLQAKAETVYSLRDIGLLRRSAASLLKESGRTEQAAGLLIKAKDWGGLAVLVMRHAESLIRQGRHRTLQEWLRKLPKDIVEQTPWILYWLGVCDMPADLAASRANLERAFAVFKLHKDAAGLYLAWSDVINTFVYEWSDFSPVDHWISELDDLLREYPDFPSQEIESRVTSAVFAALMYRQPHHPDFSRWEKRMREIVVTSTDVRLRIALSNQLVIYYAWMTGELAKAANLVSSLKCVAHVPDLDPLSYIVWRSFEAAYYWITASHGECLQAVNAGLVTAEETGIHIWDSMLLAVGAKSCTTSGALDEAQIFLDKMAATMIPTAFTMAHLYHYAAAFLALARGERERALEQAQACLDAGMKSGAPFAIAFDSFALGAALLAHDKREQGLACLAEARKLASAFRNNSTVYLTLISEAQYFLGRGEEGPGLDALAKAMTLGKRQGFVNHSAWSSSGMSLLCSKALENGIETEYVQHLIRTRGLVPDGTGMQLENWPWPIRVYALGQFRIECEERQITFTGKVQKKPLELLKALVVLGGRTTSDGKLTDILWSEAEGDAAYRSLVTSVQRLRMLLGQRDAIQFQGGQVGLDARFVWLDVWAFERYCAKADAAWKANAKEKAAQFAEKAIDLYCGPLLGRDFEEYWAEGSRETLREKFLRCIKLFGQHAEHSGDLEQAIACYRRGLVLEDRSEEIYRFLMACYGKTGRLGEAFEVYGRCRKMLDTTFGVHPSDETESVYKALKKNMPVHGSTENKPKPPRRLNN